MNPNHLRLIGTAAASAALAIAAVSLTSGDGSRSTEDLRAEVREYLLENPEVIMEAVAVLEEREAQQQQANDVELVSANADDLFNDGNSWVGGNPDGDLTIVEFLDYRCGYCRRAHPEVAALLAADENIRLVVKELPILGEESLLASRFAIATKFVEGDEAYKTLHDTLMSFEGAVNETTLRRISDALGYQTDTIAARIEDPEVTQVIAENHQLAQRLQINGTPAFVMGERLLRGYVPLAGMQQLAADERAKPQG